MKREILEELASCWTKKAVAMRENKTYEDSDVGNSLLATDTAKFNILIKCAKDITQLIELLDKTSEE